MKYFYFIRKASLSLLVLPVLIWAQDCEIHPLNLEGLNADVIAEGSGGNADEKSTHSIDADSWFSCIYYSQDFVPLNPDNFPSAEDYGGGLPNDGFFTSASSGVEYQFADYTGNNAVLLRNSVTNSVTVNSEEPFAAEALYLAVLSAEGVHTVNVTINFADNTSQSSALQALDWYQTFPPSNYIYYGFGRLSRGTGSGAPLNAFMDIGIMTIFEQTITIDAENVGKEITSIVFDKEVTTNDAATTVVFAITACEVPISGDEGPCENKTIMECGETYTEELVPDAGEWVNYTDVTWNYTGSEKVWEFTAPATGEYVFEVDAGTQDADFFLMDNCSNTANNLITNTLGYWTGDNPSETIMLTEGVTYYLIADLYTSATSPTTVSAKVTCPGDEPEGYCEPVLDCTDGDLITNVTFAGIDNDSDCSPNGYGDYTDIIGMVEAGSTNDISVTVGGGWAFESVSVWIDYNNNFSFEEDEFTFVGTGSAGDVVGQIMIPADVADGNYRMRVRVAAVGEVTATWDMACDETQGFGETEDYTITVGDLAVNDMNAFDFTYYPNPVKDVLNLSSKKEIESLSVFNLAGQKVLNHAKVSGNQVDVSSLTSGTYVCKVTLEGGQTKIFKIIKK